MELAVPAESLRWRPSTLIHGLETLPVRLVPAGTVPRTEVGKAVRVARWTGGDPPLPGLS